jgi:hypothetical protein
VRARFIELPHQSVNGLNLGLGVSIGRNKFPISHPSVNVLVEPGLRSLARHAP